MNYFAGLFDAEGYVTLAHSGAFHIATEMANEPIPNLFKENFGGSMYTRQRINRKKTWCWKTNSTDEVIHFIDSISPFSLVKKEQLILLKQYLDHRREDRGRLRKGFITSISACKQPRIRSFRFAQVKTIESPDANFFEWFAGFLDGDGCFTLYESNRQFQGQILAHNTIPEVIKYIKLHIDGTVTQQKILFGNGHAIKQALQIFAKIFFPLSK